MLRDIIKRVSLNFFLLKKSRADRRQQPLLKEQGIDERAGNRTRTLSQPRYNKRINAQPNESSSRDITRKEGAVSYLGECDTANCKHVQV